MMFYCSRKKAWDGMETSLLFTVLSSRDADARKSVPFHWLIQRFASYCSFRFLASLNNGSMGNGAQSPFLMIHRQKAVCLCRVFAKLSWHDFVLFALSRGADASPNRILAVAVHSTIFDDYLIDIVEAGNEKGVHITKTPTILHRLSARNVFLS
jgi:hypothetical protein